MLVNSTPPSPRNLQTKSDRRTLPIPALILRREVGVLCRRGERELTDYRICNLEASKFHTISSAPDEAGVSAMEFDEGENRFLLCGSSRGAVSIVDFEHSHHGEVAHQRHKRLIANRRSFHKYLITSCQWYPVDSGLFATSSMDKSVKLWDSNRLRAIETFEFESPVAQLHWGSAKSASLIAVAISSSNVHFLDPRTGNAIQHLRCKGQRINSLWWKQASNFHLLTGSDSGKIFLWDIRSGKSELAQLHTGKLYSRKRRSEPSNAESAHSNPVICVKDTKDGEKIVSMSLNRTLNCWDAQSLTFENSVEVDYEGIASKAPVFFDTCHEGSRLWAFVPTDTNITVQDLNVPCKARPHRLLQGHFQTITACAYRSNYQQLVTASTDRLVLVWVPGMDERRPEQETLVSRLHEDAYSDEDD